MSRTPNMTMIAFGLIMVTLVTLVHYYFWRRLVRDTKLKAPWRRIATSVIAILGAALPVTMILGRQLGPNLVAKYGYVPLLWMGMMVLLFFLLLTADFLKGTRNILSFLKLTDRVDPNRRTLLNRVAAGVALSSAGGLTGAAVYQGKLDPILTRVTVTLENLPKSLDRLRIAHLTDLHIGHTLDRGWLEGVVDKTNRLNPDVIAITGDVVDGDVDTLRSDLSPLAKLTAPMGVYLVTGNHEYYAGVTAWIRQFEKFGIRVLRNEHIFLEKSGGSLALLGVDDYNAHRIEPDHGPDIEKAKKGIPAEVPTLLLAHQPRAVFEAEKQGVNLVISGHTHGGQIWPITDLVRLQQPYNKGLFRHSRNTQVYVSQGTGYWGPPMRLGTRNEITEIILESQNA